MNVIFVSITILYFANVRGLPVHSGRFQHIIHNHDHDKSSHGHKKHHPTPITWKANRRKDYDFDRNKIYEVPSNRHFNDNRKVVIRRLTRKSYFNKHNYRRPNKTTLSLPVSSPEKMKKKQIFSKKHDTSYMTSSRQIYRHLPKLKSKTKQRIVKLPKTLEKSLSLGSFDHDFGITKRGVAEAELLQSKQGMTPHLPRRYIENLLKLNIWNTNDTIKVNPTSTELGRNWNIPKDEINTRFQERMMASEFSTDGAKRNILKLAIPKPTKSSFKRKSENNATHAKPTTTATMEANIKSPSDVGPEVKTKTSILDKSKIKIKRNSNIENDLKRKHNVSKSDVIQLQGIHIMFSSMKQNLSKVIPTLHLTALISNSSDEKFDNTTVTSKTQNAGSITKTFETLIGTAVIKNGHLYLVVYPFGNSKNSSLKYHGRKDVQLSTEEIVVDPEATTQKQRIDDIRQEVSKQTTLKPAITPKTGSIHITNTEANLDQISLDLQLEDFHANSHNKHSNNHGHTSHDSSHRGKSHHSHNSHHGHMKHTGHARQGSPVPRVGFAKQIERFMSPWKQMNLSSVLPYLKINSTNAKSSQEEDDSNYKMVSFIAEATDPFYKVREIIRTIKNTTNNASISNGPRTDVPIDPTVDGTFNFELKLEGAKLSNALNMSDIIGKDEITTELPLETTTFGTKTSTQPDAHAQKSDVNFSTEGPKTITPEPFKSTEITNTIELPSSTPTSTSQESLIPLHIYPSMFLDSKENDLYVTIDSVIMQKLKAENTSVPRPTAEIKSSPNVTLEALGIKKESLPNEVAIKQSQPDSTTKKPTTFKPPSTSQFKTKAVTKTFTPITRTKPSVQTSTESIMPNHYQTITSSIHNERHRESSYFTNYDNTIHTDVHGTGNGEPVITLSDVLNNIRKIQLQNSARFNLPTNNFHTVNSDNGDKVSSSKDPVVLEGPIYQDFVTNSYPKPENNEQTPRVTSPSSNGYKSWSHHAVRQALSAMLVLSVDDILADHTTLHGTIVMAQNKDQSKDSSSNSNN